MDGVYTSYWFKQNCIPTTAIRLSIKKTDIHCLTIIRKPVMTVYVSYVINANTLYTLNAIN